VCSLEAICIYNNLRFGSVLGHFRYVIQPHGVHAGRSHFSLWAGILLCVYVFGAGVLHAFVSILVNWALLKLAPYQAGTLAWMFNFPHLALWCAPSVSVLFRVSRIAHVRLHGMCLHGVDPPSSTLEPWLNLHARWFKPMPF
jgi:hypothetical protein